MEVDHGQKLHWLLSHNEHVSHKHIAACFEALPSFV